MNINNYFMSAGGPSHFVLSISPSLNHQMEKAKRKLDNEINYWH